MKTVLLTGAVMIGAVAVVAMILFGYNFPWTGFSAYTAPDGNAVPAKTLWDWLDLLVVPVVLAIGAFLLDGSRKRSEREVEADRQKQQTLDEYFAYISDLLLNKHLSEGASSNHARELARTRTLTALRLLDGRRKAQLLQFLYEAGLIGKGPTIQLNGADLRRASLDEATLSGAELRGVYFCGASIRCATLVGTDLRGSDFTRASFYGANLTNSNLAQATLARADLRMATIDNADLTDVDLNQVQMTHEQCTQLQARVP